MNLEQPNFNSILVKLRNIGLNLAPVEKAMEVSMRGADELDVQSLQDIIHNIDLFYLTNSKVIDTNAKSFLKHLYISLAKLMFNKLGENFTSKVTLDMVESFQESLEESRSSDFNTVAQRYLANYSFLRKQSIPRQKS